MISLLRAWRSIASRNFRVLALDFVLLAAAVYIGYALRLSIIIAPAVRTNLAISCVLFPLCVCIGMFLCGAYKVFWPQAGVEEYAMLARGYVAGAAIFLLAYNFTDFFVIPRSALAISLMAGILFVGSVRASWRLIELSSTRMSSCERTAQNAIIIGAGEAGAYIARDLSRKSTDIVPVGFIDEDASKKGKMISGLPVLGGDDQISAICSDRSVKVALIAIPSASGENIKKYLNALAKVGVDVRVLPPMRELARGDIGLSSMRPVELADLLRRDQITLDEEGIDAVISGRRVLVSGAGGSIGSELCLQIARHDPAEIIMLGHGESSIYNVDQRFIDEGIATPRTKVIADIADKETIDAVFRKHAPQVVFHAAAHKHVPLMEDNPREALRVNARGTLQLARAAGANGAERFVMISTDKAVHPSSVMGATKRIAEQCLRVAQAEHSKTSYMTVRFGNVLGSRGSVVPLFEKQIARGGPVTVTHPDMTRYFMLIPEAVSLVLQAASMGVGGELFVLDMGEPVKITEMAQTLIRLHGRVPDRDIKIVYTGIRDGEKLNEELFYDPARVDRTAHDKILLSKVGTRRSQVVDDVDAMLSSGASDEELKRAIFSLAER